MVGGPKGHGGGAESSVIEVGVKLGKLRVDWEEIFVKVESNVSIGSHETFKSLKDMVLVCAAARGPMGEAAASEGDDPGSLFTRSQREGFPTERLAARHGCRSTGAERI